MNDVIPLYKCRLCGRRVEGNPVCKEFAEDIPKLTSQLVIHEYWHTCYQDINLTNFHGIADFIGYKELPELEECNHDELSIEVLESQTGWYHGRFCKKCGPYGRESGYYEYSKNTLSQLPIKKDNHYQQIVMLVDQIVKEKERNPQANTKQLESQIDSIVYQLYELTSEDIDLVEGSVK